jgi:hypothetical protein
MRLAERRVRRLRPDVNAGACAAGSPTLHFWNHHLHPLVPLRPSITDGRPWRVSIPVPLTTRTPFAMQSCAARNLVFPPMLLVPRAGRISVPLAIAVTFTAVRILPATPPRLLVADGGRRGHGPAGADIGVLEGVRVRIVVHRHGCPVMSATSALVIGWEACAARDRCGCGA